MYKIFAYPFGNPNDKRLIYAPNNRNALVLSPKLTREVSKGGSLSFTMTRDHEQYESLQKMSTCITVEQDDKEIWRGRILSHEADWYNRRVIYCEGALSYFNDSAITPFNYEGKLAQFLQHLIDAHNQQCGNMKMKRFELGTVTAALGDLVVHYGDRDSYGVGEDYGSTWDIIDKMVLKVYGGYAYCTYNPATGNNVLNYCDQSFEADRLVNQTIEYGVNLLDFTEKTDTNSLFTRVYPMGSKHTVEETKWKWKFLWWGEKYTESHEERYGISGTDAATVNKYLPKGYSYRLDSSDGDCGWIQNDAAAQKFGIVSALGEYDTDSDNDTFAAGVQDLQKNSLMVTSYTVKAVDLRDAGYDKDRLTFAGYAHIISKPHSIDVIMLCTKLVEPLDQPDKKEYTFGMTRQTLTDRQVANLGRTNLLDEDTASAEKYQQSTLNQLFKYQKSNDKRVDEVDKKAGEAAKTATNFLEFTPENGLIVRHDQLPNKRVQITNDGIKVLSGSSMVNIKSDSISITDGNGSCTIDSGKITFYGIRNARIWDFGDNSSFGAQTIPLDLSDFSAVYLTYTSKKGSTWWASGGTAGCVTMVIPVNGVEYAMTYPWNTTHMRTVRVNSGGITFGPGRERTSNYVTGNNYTPAVVPTNFSIDLESPGSDGWTQNDSLCMPRELYGFM
uniref:phage tail protein n=1 Tax=Faecalibacterium sp. TaxID=1971605 RepID=UPI003FEFFD8A